MLTDSLIQQADQDFKKIIEHLRGEYGHLQIGRASAAVVDHLMVEAYGSKQQLKGLANIAVPDARTIQIQPWDKSQLQAIEKAIMTSGLNLNPSNDGIVVRISIPPLTEERRKDLVKVVQRMAEESKIGIRHSRQTAMDKFKTLSKNKEITEDELKGSEKRLQDKVDASNQEIEALARQKEHDVMTI